MKRQDGKNVRGNRDGRGRADGGMDDRERLKRCLLRTCVLQLDWKASCGTSGQVRGHLHTLKTDGNGLGWAPWL